MASEPTFTPPQRCGHCGNTSPMEIVGQYSQVREHAGRAPDEPLWDAGHIWELLLCAACSDISLRKYYWHDGVDPEYEHIEFQLLYPGPARFPEGLPPDILRAFEAAQRVRTVDPNAYGVLVGRVLEAICINRDATGRFLGNKLADLAAKGEIPAKLVDVANGLKDLRNVGAHVALGELTSEEVPILDGLARAILEYVYSAPALAKRAEARLVRLRATKGSPPP